VPDSDYFRDIEGHFAIRRGTPFILSAKDWGLMTSWKSEGVPLSVVIEAIDSVFEKNEASGRRKAISSLSYCRHAVKELWEHRRDLQVGSGAEPPESAPEAALEVLAAELAAMGDPVVQEFAGRVRELAGEKSVPRIEERLIETEHELVAALLEGLPDDDRKSIDAEVSRLIGDPSQLDEKTRARTREANLRRIVRDRFGLPRLTLFR
jgi:hypothetical protein